MSKQDNGAATSLALNANWLDTGTATGGFVPTTATGTVGQSLTIGDTFGGWSRNRRYNDYNWVYPYQSVYVSPSSDPRPIKLTLTEVEHLRKRAKGDQKLRKTLQKFTDLIEITVDF